MRIIFIWVIANFESNHLWEANMTFRATNQPWEKYFWQILTITYERGFWKDTSENLVLFKRSKSCMEPMELSTGLDLLFLLPKYLWIHVWLPQFWKSTVLSLFIVLDSKLLGWQMRYQKDRFIASHHIFGDVRSPLTSLRKQTCQITLSIFQTQQNENPIF